MIHIYKNYIFIKTIFIVKTLKNKTQTQEESMLNLNAKY